VFSNCTLPLLIWSVYPFSPADVFKIALDKLVMLLRSGAYDRGVTLVPVLPHNSRMPEYMRFWYQTLSNREVVTFSRLSQRLPPGTLTNWTGEGVVTRCFERMVLCRLGGHSQPSKFWGTGEHLFVWRGAQEWESPSIF
jgi:hypothetical protein